MRRGRRGKRWEGPDLGRRDQPCPSHDRDRDFTLAPGDTLLVDLAGVTAGTGYDQWVINETGTAPDGTVTLGGATLTLNLTYAPTAGTTYTIIDNDDTDAVVGTFGNVPTNGGTITATYNSTIFTFRVFYTGGDGNDVVLVDSSTRPRRPTPRTRPGVACRPAPSWTAISPRPHSRPP